MRGAVVAGVDRSRRGLQTLEWAARDATLRGCRLLIVHALPWYHYDVMSLTPGQWAELEFDSEELLADAVTIVRETSPSLHIDTRRPTTPPLNGLYEEAEAADVVVVGARGHGGFHNLLLGSMSLRLAGHAACPVVVVREGTHEVSHEIIAGLDGSTQSFAALGYAFEEARIRRALLRVVYAWQLPELSPRQPLMAMEDLRRAEEEGREVLVHALADWSESYPDVQTVVDVAYGNPARAFVNASVTADLIVVGARGHGGSYGLSLETTSHAVLHHAHCTVAIVR